MPWLRLHAASTHVLSFKVLTVNLAAELQRLISIWPLALSPEQAPAQVFPNCPTNAEALAERDTRFNCQATQESRRAMVGTSAAGVPDLSCAQVGDFLRSGFLRDCRQFEQVCGQAMDRVCDLRTKLRVPNSLGGQCPNFGHYSGVSRE